MKKSITCAASVLLVTTCLSNAALAAPAPAQSAAAIAVGAFGGTAVSGVELLDTADLQDTRGRLLPLLGSIGPIATIVGIDLALIGAFWGVYVPTYAPTAGAAGTCFACDNVTRLERR